MFIATAAVIYSLEHGLQCAPLLQSTQPSTLRGIITLAMVDVDDSIFGGLTAQVDWLGLRVGGHPALSLHSSDEPGELSQ